MNDKLLTEHNLEFLSLKGGCTGAFESIHIKMQHCWKSHVLTPYETSKTLHTCFILCSIHGIVTVFVCVDALLPSQHLFSHVVDVSWV